MPNQYSLHPEVLVADIQDYSPCDYAPFLPYFPAEQLTAICHSAELANTHDQLLTQAQRLLFCIEAFTQDTSVICHPLTDILVLTYHNLLANYHGSPVPVPDGVYLDTSIQLGLGHDVIVSPLAVPSIWYDGSEISFGSWVAQPTCPLVPVEPEYPDSALAPNQALSIHIGYKIDPLFVFHNGRSTLPKSALDHYATQIAERPNQHVRVVQSIRSASSRESRPAAQLALAVLATASICTAAHST